MTNKFLRDDGTFQTITVTSSSSTVDNTIVVNTTSVLGGTAGNLLYDNAATVGELANLPVSKLNSGTGASTTTFWRGDGTWAAVTSTSTGTIIVVNTTQITGGTNTNLLYDNGGTIGEYANLPISKLNGGTGASTTTFWRGDGSWSPIALVPPVDSIQFAEDSSIGWWDGVSSYGTQIIYSNNSGVFTSLTVTNLDYFNINSVGLTEITGQNGPSAITAPYVDGEAPYLFNVTSGSTVTPVTNANPTVGIIRTEVITDQDTAGGQNAALFVESDGNNIGPANCQVNGITSKVTQNGVGDACAVFNVAHMNTGANRAYGGFFDLNANVSGASAVGIECVAFNNTGSDNTADTIFSAIIGINLQAGGNNISQSGIQLGTVGNGAFDVGLKITSGSVITAPILAPLMTPANSGDTGSEGCIKWDGSFIYVCTGADTWKRAALSTF